MWDEGYYSRREWRRADVAAQRVAQLELALANAQGERDVAIQQRDAASKTGQSLRLSLRNLRRISQLQDVTIKALRRLAKV